MSRTDRKMHDPRMGMLNVTQHWFDHDMDQWGKSRGDEVFEQGNRLSRLLGPDGAPLSKRHGAVAVEWFKEQGILPEALVNYLALLGWSFDETTTFFSIDDLVKDFDLSPAEKGLVSAAPLAGPSAPTT